MSDFQVVPGSTPGPSPFLSGQLQASGTAPFFGDASVYGGLLHKASDGKGAARRPVLDPWSVGPQAGAWRLRAHPRRTGRTCVQAAALAPGTRAGEAWVPGACARLVSCLPRRRGRSAAGSPAAGVAPACGRARELRASGGAR